MGTKNQNKRPLPSSSDSEDDHNFNQFIVIRSLKKDKQMSSVSPSVIEKKSYQHAISVKRDDTNTFVLTFNTPILPKHVKVGFKSVGDVYILNPLRCFHCQRFGHHSDNCKQTQKVCGKCGVAGQDDGSADGACDGKAYYANLGGRHPAYSIDCSARRKEKEILRVKYTNNITFPEARQIVEKPVYRVHPMPVVQRLVLRPWRPLMLLHRHVMKPMHQPLYVYGSLYVELYVTHIISCSERKLKTSLCYTWPDVVNDQKVTKVSAIIKRGISDIADMYPTIGYIGLMCMFVTAVANGKDSLILVQAVFRHGDRSPIRSFPNDKHRDFWKQGLGQLTQEGMLQEYNLGKFLKSRYGYGVLLSSKYNHSEITITSSDYDRALMSAYCVLSAIYPPDGTDQRWNPDLNWQPIPVHTKPRHEDFIISMQADCPKFDKLLTEYNGNKTKAIFMAKHQDLIENIVNISGLPIESWNSITDSLFCQYIHNFSLPEWASILPLDVVKSIRDVFATYYLPTPELAKLKGGPLLMEIIDNMKRNLNNESSTTVYLYSGHDTTLIALLRVLNVFNNRNPSYSSCVLLELWKSGVNETIFVKVIYRNETDSNRTISLPIPGCVVNCPFKTFISILTRNTPKDIKEECNIRNDIYWINDNRVTLLFLASLLTLLVIVMVIFTILIYRDRHYTSAYKAVPTRDEDI
ncbi:testicular acid phosphatase homolog [Ylistrum balloti]|uniref:testicular acid phosphatase homolog n=1 Tax=Ylistrum balloti TaxID=509963 RepID=UPI0029058332|nr:testicular acid phosphatase homolog [Ylistrum balloti]